MPAGRPSKLRRVHHVEDRTGKAVTVEEVILRAVRRGEYVETACRVARIAKGTLYGWLDVAKVADDKRRQHLPLTAHEAACIEFSDALDEAEAIAEITLGDAIMRAGMEPSTTVRTLTKRIPVAQPDGSVVYEQQVETTETVNPPDVSNLRWRAERRFMSRWGQKGSLEVSGPEGGPIEVVDDRVRAAELLASLEAFKAGAEAQRALEAERAEQAAP